MLWLKSKTP